jgi:two-component system, sensor histidine kinase and response regulator
MSKILVIDDESWLREMIRLALEQQGFEVVEAMDSAEGVTQAREQLPDLILCDVNMDKAGAGYTTLAKLREDPATAAIPFILMTGLADAAGMRHGMDLGADDYLPKPFKVDELYATVNARLRKVQTVREEAEKKLTCCAARFPSCCRTKCARRSTASSPTRKCSRNRRTRSTRKTIAEMSQEICQSGQRLERLIENFLIYAQLEIVTSIPQSINQLRSAKTTRPAELVRGAPLRRRKRPDAWTTSSWTWPTPPLPMAEDYFKKIAVELVQNALKFSDPASRCGAPEGHGGRGGILRARRRPRIFHRADQPRRAPTCSSSGRCRTNRASAWAWRLPRNWWNCTAVNC